MKKFNIRVDYENRLKEIEKEDLIDFIIAMQSRGCFKGVCY